MIAMTTKPQTKTIEFVFAKGSSAVIKHKFPQCTIIILKVLMTF